MAGDGKARLGTTAVHAGAPDEARAWGVGPAGERPHVAPIFLTTNFEYPSALAADEAAQGRAFLYTRHGNPTVQAFERALAALEQADGARAFASGMAAVTATLTALGSGGEVVVSEGIYGGSTEFARDFGPRFGITPRFVPAWDTAAVEKAIGEKTRAVLVETISNPLLRVSDLPALAALAKAKNVALIVDSTFATPCSVNPLSLGATAVIHSLSKYINGHGDVIGGVVAAGEAALKEIHHTRTITGGTLDPFAAWLALRGLRTLPLRFERQCATAARLARVFQDLPAVKAVHFPGLTTHPDHERAQRLLRTAGAMVSFELADEAAARRFYDRVTVIGRAASLGDVASLLTHPASFSHKGLPPDARAAAGITDGLLRLSTGIEDAEDLEQDIRQALASG